MCELDIPAMVHVSAACNDCFHTTGSHYLGADTTGFQQLVMSEVFKDFPSLKIIIPHGGGAVPYHWGRFRGILQDQGYPPLEESALNNIFFDTCVYHQRGIDLLLDIVPVKNILFASEMIGAVRGLIRRQATTLTTLSGISITTPNLRPMKNSKYSLIMQSRCLAD